MSERTLSYYGAVRSKADDVDNFANASIFGFASKEERDKWMADQADSSSERLVVNYRKAKAVLKVKKHQCITINLNDHSCQVVRNPKYPDSDLKARQKPEENPSTPA